MKYFIFFIVQKVQEEGKHAIDSPGSPNQFDIPPEDYTLRKENYYWIDLRELLDNGYLY